MGNGGNWYQHTSPAEATETSSSESSITSPEDQGLGAYALAQKPVESGKPSRDLPKSF